MEGPSHRGPGFWTIERILDGFGWIGQISDGFKRILDGFWMDLDGFWTDLDGNPSQPAASAVLQGGP